MADNNNAMKFLGIGAGIQGLFGLGRSIVGGIQSIRANRDLKNFKLPQYTIPSELDNMLDLARQRANAQELPGQSLIENKLGAQTAYGQRAAEKYAGTGGQALGAVTGLYGQQMGAVRDLGIQFANFRAQREAELGRAQQVYAQAQDKQWEINQWLPAQYKYNELQSQKQAGASNLWGGLQDIAGAGMGYMGARAQTNAMQGMMPQYGQSRGTGGGLTPDIKANWGPRTDSYQYEWLQNNVNAQMPGTYNPLSAGRIGNFGILDRYNYPY